MLAIPIDYLPMNAERDFRGRRSLYPGSGDPVAIVQVVQCPRHWDMDVCVGHYVQKMRVKIQDETEIWQEENYAIRDCEIISSTHESAIASDMSLPSKLDLIRLQFGIGTKHLAEALGVERPTVYAWQDDKSKPQDKRRDRIEALVELAKYWKSLSERTLGKRAFEPVDNGQSVMDMLSAEDLSIELVKTALRKWSEDHEARVGSLRRKAVAKREEMQRRGIKPLPDYVIDQTLREFAKSSI